MSGAWSAGKPGSFDADNDGMFPVDAYAVNGIGHTTGSCGMVLKSASFSNGRDGTASNFSKGIVEITTNNKIEMDSGSNTENLVSASDSDKLEPPEISSIFQEDGSGHWPCTICSKGHLNVTTEISVPLDIFQGHQCAHLQECVVPCLLEDGMEYSPANDKDEVTSADSGYETPSEGLFDPFAPAAEELARAPKKRMQKKISLPLRRQLKFDSSSDDSDGDYADDVGSHVNLDDATSDKMILEDLHMSFMEIALNDLLYRENFLIETSSLDKCKTPATTPMPLLSGVAETCPGAPMRNGFKSRKIDPTICRKLDFSHEGI